MLFDLDESPGEWFQFFTSRIDTSTGETVYDDPEGPGRACIRSLAPFFDERRGKREKAVEHVVNPKTHALERIVFLKELSPKEEAQERDDMWDYAITGFEGFKNAKTKEPLVCNRETKLKLMKVPMFSRFVARCLELLANTGVAEKEEEEKN